MATYGDEPVDSYFYSSYNPYTGRYPRAKDAGWKVKTYLSHYGDASDAFNNQQRAQLKSILSQINPKLTPRLRKANTKDVAVQVNPKRDASVQCAIGPRTLLAVKRDFRRKVRYPRTLAVYSPIAYRSVTSFLFRRKFHPEREFTYCFPLLYDSLPVASDSFWCKNSSDLFYFLFYCIDTNEANKAIDLPFLSHQFLEQKYGYYHCREDNLRWESAYVWCVQGTNKVYFKQYCRKCQKEFNPYRVEDITCHVSFCSVNENGAQVPFFIF
ncbi:putative zygote arrest protein 1 isoform 2 [Scophthalmus maximus]|uniref:Putative zygote arrest protein 1 isoform 2 n=1 Tax=Scophthalmus maximus TaxID=52904 RepID=A0A2U9C8J3_SCOMX|nr:putative zygote arrest protein 1 isoform 2 [Scophthalmus maximus]